MKLCRTLMSHHLSTAPFVQGMSPIPQLFRYNRRNRRIGIHNPFALIHRYFPFTAVIERLRFIRAIPAFVLWIFQNVTDRQLVKRVSSSAAEPFRIQSLRNSSDPQLLVGVKMEDSPYCPCLLFVNGENAVFLVISPQPIVAQYMTVFDRLPKAFSPRPGPLQPSRQDEIRCPNQAY